MLTDAGAVLCRLCPRFRRSHTQKQARSARVCPSMRNAATAGHRRTHACRIAELVWIIHDEFGENREGHDFSRAVKSLKMYPRFSARGALFAPSTTFSATSSAVPLEPAIRAALAAAGCPLKASQLNNEHLIEPCLSVSIVYQSRRD